MQTDNMHSFFGGYCDCFVSDDAGILKKSKTLYKLFNIETQNIFNRRIYKSI